MNTEHQKTILASESMRITAEQINWRVAAGELLLIVVGILLALAIDSWAEQRKEAEQASVYLNDIAAELRTDAQHLQDKHDVLEQLIAKASALLATLENNDEIADDPGSLLIGSVFGEGITRESAIWREIQMTGALRLITDSTLRNAIVTHYLEQEINYEVINANFMPAVRDVRALAWDVMPPDSFPRFMQSNQSGVAGQTVVERLRARDDSVYLLKRLIVTSRVARRNIEFSLQSTLGLLDRLELRKGQS